MDCKDFQRLAKKIDSGFKVVGIVDDCSCIVNFLTHALYDYSLDWDPEEQDHPVYLRFTKDASACNKDGGSCSVPVEIDGYYVEKYLPLNNAREFVPRDALKVWDGYVERRAKNKVKLWKLHTVDDNRLPALKELLFGGAKKAGDKHEYFGVVAGDLIKITLADGTECIGHLIRMADEPDAIVIEFVKPVACGGESDGSQKSIRFADMVNIEVIGDHGVVRSTLSDSFVRAREKAYEFRTRS